MSAVVRLLRCKAILPLVGSRVVRYVSKSSEGSINLGMLRLFPLRCRRSCSLVSKLAQQLSQASQMSVLILVASRNANSCSVVEQESISLIATSLRDCSKCLLGFGPSSRLRPSVDHGSEVSVLKARAVSSERSGVVSVAVDSVCHDGIPARVLPSVVCAAVMRSPDRVISASTYS